MLAWVNTVKSKEQAMKELRQHIIQDELTAGAYWNLADTPSGYRGCAVGCLTGGRHHDLYPALFGIPVEWAWVHDVLFEMTSRTISNRVGQEWAYAYLAAIAPGSDLKPAFYQFIKRLLTFTNVQSQLDPEDQAIFQELILVLNSARAGMKYAAEELFAQIPKPVGATPAKDVFEWFWYLVEVSLRGDESGKTPCILTELRVIIKRLAEGGYSYQQPVIGDWCFEHNKEPHGERDITIAIAQIALDTLADAPRYPTIVFNNVQVDFVTQVKEY